MAGDDDAAATAARAAALAARAQAITGEAAGKLTDAMRGLVFAAAGLTGFAVETARDVVGFLVRRGEMAKDEGERLLRDAEAAYARRVAAGRVPERVPARAPRRAVRIRAPATEDPVEHRAIGDLRKEPSPAGTARTSPLIVIEHGLK